MTIKYKLGVVLAGGVVAVSLAAGLLSAPAFAQDRSDLDPITIIVPFPPGGSVDMIARLVQPALSEELGVQVIIDNRGGASGSIGATAAARAEPDGRTWLFVFDTQAVNPSLMPDLAFDSKTDLDPVMLIGTSPNVLATQTAKPFEDFEALMEAGRQDPGALTYGTIGTGSLGHLTMVLLEEETGVELTHVPYAGGGPAVIDAVAGHVDLVMGSAALVSPQMEAGGLRPLLQTGSERHPALPDTPTADEIGFEGFESIAWWGVFAPAGTPQEDVDWFHAGLTAALEREDVVTQLTDAQKMQLVRSSPDDFRTFFETEMESWGAIVREHNITSGS